MMEKNHRPPMEAPQPNKKKRRKRQNSSHALVTTTKWVVIIFCLLISGLFGLVVGFSIIGEGNVSEVFNLKMWKHIFDLVFNA